MFSIHDIIEIAIKIEENGEEAYRVAAREVANRSLASMLKWLADQEAEHVEWFTELRAKVGHDAVSDELEGMGRSMLRRVVGDQSFSLDEVNWSDVKTLEQVLDIALEMELDTALFYQTLAGFVSEDDSLRHLETIVEEEKSHGRLLLEFQQTGEVPDYAGSPSTPSS